MNHQPVCDSRKHRSRLGARRYRPVVEALEDKLLLAQVFCVSSGDWNDPSTWRELEGNSYVATVPTGGDSVIINDYDVLTGDPATYDVTVTGSAMADSIAVTGGSQLSLTGSLAAHSLQTDLNDQPGRTVGNFNETSNGQLSLSPTYDQQGNLQSGVLDLVAGNTISGEILAEGSVGFGGAMTWDGATIGGRGAIQSAAQIVIGAGTRSTIAANFTNFGGELSVSGQLSVTGSLTLFGGPLDGSGEVKVTGSMTETGTFSPINDVTIVNDGTFMVGGGQFEAATLDNAGTANLGAYINVLNGSLIDNLPNATMTVTSGGITGDSSNTFENGGTLLVVSPTFFVEAPFDQTGSGTTEVTTGSLILDGGGTIAGPMTVGAGATLELSPPPQPSPPLFYPPPAGLTGTYAFPDSDTISGPGTLDVSGATLDVAESLTNSAPGAWSGTIAGSGTVTNAAALIGFGVTISQATVENSGTINSASLIMREGAVFDNLAGGITSILGVAGDPTDAFENAGAILSSSVSITAPFEQTSTGSTQVSSGSCFLYGGATIAGSVTIAAGATLGFSTPAGSGVTYDIPISATISGPGQFFAAGSALDVSGELTISGTSIWSAGTATGSGKVLVEGTVSLRGPASFDETNLDASGTISVSRGSLIFTNGASFDNLPGSSVTLNNSGVRGDSSSAFENNGTINVPSGVDGFISLTFNQSATGSMQADGPALLESGGTITGSLSVAAGASFDFVSGTYDLDGNSLITGAGNVSVSGATVNDAGTYDISGTTTIDPTSTLSFTGGVINTSGDVNNDGTLSLSPSGLNVAGNYTQSSTGTYQVGIGGYSPGVQYGQLNVFLNATLAGTLDINLLGDFVPKLGDAFQVIVSLSRTGDFDNVTGLDLGDNNRLHAGWDGGSLWLDDGFVVLNTHDSGHGSLRYVIDQVNEDPISPDAITFAASTQGPFPISLQSDLPDLSRDQVTLTGLSTTTIDGLMNGTALTISGEGDTVDSMKIQFSGEASGGAGLSITGNHDTVTRTQIEYCGIGILISQGASNNTIGGTADVGNVFDINRGDGVHIQDDGTSMNVIEGNQLGGDAVGNFGNGVFIGGGASDNTIGGASGYGNQISNNDGDGVHVQDDDTTKNVVEGNLIGTDSFGLAAEGNLGDGVFIGGGALSNTISGNVSSASGGAGIEISGDGTSQNLVTDNTVGINLIGNGILPNLHGGVLVDDGATDNTIGGPTAGWANAISGNIYSAGVVISGSGTSDNLVAANYIGTTATGATKLGNKSGVVVAEGAADNTIGGTTTGAGNVIAYNAGNGVTIGQNATDAATGNAIEENSIFSNSKLGIDLGNDGVTANDSSGHAGPNLFQDFPVLTSVQSGPSGTTIAGTVHGPANSTVRIELFATAAQDPSLYGQGQTFLGALAAVPTNASGNGAFTLTTSQSVPQTSVISATATDASGDTSEFSLDFPVFHQVYLSCAESGIVFNRFTGVYTGTITLTNTGTAAILGPIQVVLTGLTSGVTLIDASGTTSDGNPYITANGPLPSGKSITITLQFRKTSSNLFVNYVPKFYSGTFPT